MAKSRRMALVVSLVIGLVAAHSTKAAERSGAPSHIRFKHPRIADLFRYAMKKSPAFEDLVRTLELQDRVVYIEEGRCYKSHSCLRLLSPPGRYIQIRLDPREPITSVVPRLAHELYHAGEIAREPSVVDAGSLRTLYERIGYRNMNCPESDCWETRAAVAFEALVTRQVNASSRPLACGGAARRQIAIRVDPDVLERFRKEARRRKIGYQTLINDVLAQHVGKDVA